MKEETIGLSEISSTQLECGDCGTKLVDIVLIETNDQRLKRSKAPLRSQYTVIDCPKCGSSSFKSDIIEGTIVIGSVRDGYGVDVQDSNFEDGIINTVLRISK